MRLLNPVAWLGALLVALPIAIHLFSRQPARTMAFPSLRFLDLSRVLPTRRTKLTDLVLLAVRVLTILLAAFALTQPLWARAIGANGDVSRVVIVESAARDRAVLEPRADSLVQSAAQALRVTTPTAASAIPGALAWLSLQHTTRELVLLTANGGTALDSLDIAGIPADVRVVVAPCAGAGAGVDAAPAQRVVLWAGHGSATRERERDARAVTAARLSGAANVRDIVAAAESLAIVVAGPDADTVSAWRDRLTMLNTPWMSDAVAQLHADTTVAATLGALTLGDTAVATPWSVIARAANGAPALLAAAHGSQMLVVVRAPFNTATSDLLRAAVLLGASRVFDVSPRATRTLDSATVARWIAARDTRTALGTANASGEYDTGPSDARYIWLAVLLLLGVETALRRRMATTVPSV